LIFDFSNILYSIFFLDVQKGGLDGSENLIRHLCLNKILSIKNRLEASSKKIILCFDHKLNWRKSVFTYYKAHRAKMRAESDLDFKKLFQISEDFYHELKSYFPFYTLRNEYIEADDWVAVLTKHFAEQSIPDNVVIISTDKDFYQLQKYKNVLYQYDHINYNPMRIENPEKVLKVKVLCGDAGDGIPNVLSDDDTFVTEGKRQSRFGEKKAWQHVIDDDIDKFICENKLEINYKRNNRLINFDYIPKQIQDAILQKFVTYQVTKNVDQLAAYFNGKNMEQMLNRTQEFFI